MPTTFEVIPNQSALSKINCVIRHAEFVRTHDRVLELIEESGPTRIVLVPGPAGVGKSTLIKDLQEDLDKSAGSLEPQRMLHARVSVKAPGPRPFSWKDFYIQLLEALDFPFAHQERALIQPRERDAQMRFLPMSSEQRARTQTEVLFRVLQHVIKVRSPKVIFLDEAHHFARIRTPEALRQQLEHIKYLADETGVLFVLFCTYELIELAGLNGQLLRRCETVPFHRYRFDPNAAEGLQQLDPFGKVVLEFEKRLGAHVGCDFAVEGARLYAGTIGCVGLLRDWLGRALVRATKRGEKITTKLLDETSLSVRDLKRLLAEATVGEAACEKADEGQAQLWERLGLPTADVARAARPGKPRRRGRPGTRKPHRDRVGPSDDETGEELPV